MILVKLSKDLSIYLPELSKQTNLGSFGDSVQNSGHFKFDI